jgi:hypothetical protein
MSRQRGGRIRNLKHEPDYSGTADDCIEPVDDRPAVFSLFLHDCRGPHRWRRAFRKVCKNAFRRGRGLWTDEHGDEFIATETGENGGIGG